MAPVNSTVRLALTLLRVGAASMMITHGVARARLDIVDDFGVYLDGLGYPGGFYVAWAITLIEIIGGLSMAAGHLVRPLTAWFTFQLLVGIYLIHGRAGWFVVGAGRNGMEFSVLLILCFAVVALTTSATYVLGRSASPLSPRR